MNGEKLIKSIEERIQLALVISIFFPSLLATFFSSAKEATVGLVSKSILPEFLLVAVYLINYVIFQGVKKLEISEKILKAVNILVLINIGFFIVPTIFFATMDPNAPIASLTWLDVAILRVSVYGLPILAGVTFSILFILFTGGLGDKFAKLKF